MRGKNNEAKPQASQRKLIPDKVSSFSNELGEGSTLKFKPKPPLLEEVAANVSEQTEESSET